MRLWPEQILNKIPRQQLLGQHRECCALRGKGWGKPHSTINYIFEYKLEDLIAYHLRVMDMMEKRGYNPNEKWREYKYRGKKVGYDNKIKEKIVNEKYNQESYIYDEHNQEYLQECIINLDNKGCICRFLEGVI